MNRCANCGRELMEGLNFCGYCGTPVPKEPEKVEEPKKDPETVQCSHCKNDVPADMLFCPECGYRLNKTTAEKPAPKPQPKPEPESEPEPPKPVSITTYGEIAEKFIAQQNIVEIGKIPYHCFDVNLLRSKLYVPANAKTLWAVDTTTLNTSKNGFIVTDRGIYSKQLFANSQYISWEEFVSTELKRRPDTPHLEISFKYPNVIQFFGTPEAKDKVFTFFVQLQQYIKQTTEMGTLAGELQGIVKQKS